MYGITDEDREFINTKLKSQREFLKEHELKTISANLAPDKYIAELRNRVDCLTAQSLDSGLIPIFITITLPSEYHINSKKYVGYTAKDGNKELYRLWKLLLGHRALKDSEYHYVQTKEPHKDGTPHQHCLMFIQSDRLERFENAFKNLMKRNEIKQYKFKKEFISDKYNNAVKSVIAYVLKYIFKTFKSFKDGKIGDVGFWYIKHKIRRVTLSRSHVPLYIFRKINYAKKWQDMIKVTKLYNYGAIITSQHKLMICHLYMDENGDFNDDNLWMRRDWTKKSERIRLKYQKRKDAKREYIPLIIDDEEYLLNLDTNKYSKKIIIPAYMRDYELINYYKYLNYNFDYLDIDLVHYGITKNECIDRGLIFEEKVSLNDYNLDFDEIS